MTDDSLNETIVHGRCGCGQRYRVRHACAGKIIRCPKCKRPITLTDADLRAAAAGIPLKPVQGGSDRASGINDDDFLVGLDKSAPPEARRTDDEPIHLAHTGARPGRVGSVHSSDEALARAALGGGTLLGQPVATPSAALSPEELARLPQRTLNGRFLRDLLQSLYLAGRIGNLVHIALTAVVCALPYLFMSVAGQFIGCFALPIGLIATAVLFLYIAQFYWRTLTRTAGGDDELPLVDPDWDWWEDALKPLLWLAFISLACFGPWITATNMESAEAWTVYAALVVGSFVWPVAVMSVALGESLLFLRPDWLIRCIWGIGPVYIVAWLLVVGVVYACDRLYDSLAYLEDVAYIGPFVALPLAAFIWLYQGYVVFRTLGLLFRHFRHRFPWQF